MYRILFKEPYLVQNYSKNTAMIKNNIGKINRQLSIQIIGESLTSYHRMKTNLPQQLSLLYFKKRLIYKYDSI